MENIKIGIIGVGGGGSAHIGYFRAIEGCEVKKVFDIKDQSLERVYKTYGVEGTKNLDDILKDKEISVISVCVPDMFHADYCIKALDAGKHVICEKPLSNTIEDCNKIAEKVKKAGLVFAVQHQMRFLQWTKLARKLMDSGELGKIFAVEADYIHDMTKRATTFDDWRMKKETTQNPVTGGASHSIDMMRYLIGEVDEVFAYANHIAFPDYPVEDCVMILLKFKNGVLGRNMVVIGCKRPIDFPLAVMGTKGTLKSNRLYLEDLSVKDFVDLPGYFYDHQGACINSISDFIDKVKNGGEPLVNAVEAAKSVEVCVAVIKSYKEGKPVKIKD